MLEEEVFRQESNVKKILALMLTSFLVLAGCQTTLSSEPQVSNLVDKSSLTEVKKRLEATLPEEDVNQFLSFVTDYNDTIQETSLLDGFKAGGQPEYDVAKIDQLWLDAKGNFIGTNCRINTYTLLQSTMTIPDRESKSQLLFMDHEAIQEGGLMTEQDLAKFNYLYSAIPT